MTLEPSEAAVVRQMARKLIGGESYRDIAWWANEQGHTTAQGRPWYPVTVRNMLRKARYGGKRIYNGVEYDGQWEPVFTPPQWERLQLEVRLRSDEARSNGAVKYLLTGLTYCGVCGKSLNGSRRVDRPGAPMRRVYVCRVAGHTQRRSGCGGVRRNADALDDFITELVLYRLDTPDLAEMLIQPRAEETELTRLVNDREEQRHRIDNLIEMLATGALDDQEFRKARTIALTKLNKLEKELATVNRRRHDVEIPLSQTLREAWDSASPSWRRSLLALVIQRIVVHRGATKRVFYKKWRFDSDLIEIQWADD